MLPQEVSVQSNVRLRMTIVSDRHGSAGNLLSTMSSPTVTATIRYDRASPDFDASSAALDGCAPVRSVGSGQVLRTCASRATVSCLLVLLATGRLLGASAASDARHFCGALDDFLWVTLLERGQPVHSLLLLGVSIELLLVGMLLEVFDLGDVGIVLIVDIVCHEVNALKLALYLTQVHFFLNNTLQI